MGSGRGVGPDDLGAEVALFAGVSEKTREVQAAAASVIGQAEGRPRKGSAVGTPRERAVLVLKQFPMHILHINLMCVRELGRPPLYCFTDCYIFAKYFTDYTQLVFGFRVIKPKIPGV